MTLKIVNQFLHDTLFHDKYHHSKYNWKYCQDENGHVD